MDEYQFKNKDKFGDALVEDDCSICLLKYKITDKLKLLPCKHTFHKHCIKSWLYTNDNCKCPLCNFNINEEIQKRKSELENHIYQAEHEDEDSG